MKMALVGSDMPLLVLFGKSAKSPSECSHKSIEHFTT